MNSDAADITGNDSREKSTVLKNVIVVNVIKNFT
jgi:hypothetical protein